MDKRATIKDIAEKAGVSMGTVHCALNNKPGVSETNRQRIIEIAKALDYRPNSLAASLKRKTIRIAAALPGVSDTSRHYFSFVWEGIHSYLRSMEDYNVELVEVPYYQNINSHSDTLLSLLETEEIDGLLTTSYQDPKSIIAVENFVKKDIPVILIGNDVPQTGRMCCVQPNYQIIGRTLAELISRQIPADGEIFMCAGDIIVPSHYLIVQGFNEYIQEKSLNNKLHFLHTSELSSDVYGSILKEFDRKPNISACCSVNASNSVLLGRALEETGKAGKIIAVGSDLFEENANFLRSGTFTNLIYKKPYDQGTAAVKYLTEYLLRDERPISDVVYVGSEIIFQSSLPIYDTGLYRALG